MLPLKVFRDKARGLPDLLNYAAVIDDGVVLGKDGALMAAWSYRGQDLASCTARERAGVSARVNAALSRLGSGWMVNVDCIRLPAVDYPDASASHFPDPITSLIDDERRHQFRAEGGHYESAYVITLSYLPPVRRQSKLADAMIDDDRGGAMPSLGAKLLTQFNERLIEIEGQLSSVLRLTRLRGESFVDEYGERQTRDHLLAHLSACITGRRHPILLPPCPMYLDAVIGGHDFWTGLMSRLEDDYIAVIGIDGFPQASTPGMLNLLDSLPVAYRWSTRFTCLDPVDALGQLKGF